MNRIVVWGLTALSCLPVFSVLAEDYSYEFAPEVFVPHIRKASKSLFVHAADGEVVAGGVAYFRFKFNLETLPSLTKSSLYFHLGYSSGATVYVNGYGYKNNGSKCCEHMVVGENTIAIVMTNQSAKAGMTFTLKCRDAAGTDLYSIHCTESVKGTVKTPSAGWELPGFDDSSWPTVKVLGDAFAEPWYTEGSWYYTDQVKNITTQAERVNFEAGNYVDPSLPAGLADEPEPVARVVYRGSSPYIELNGELREPLLNICQVGDNYNESAIVRCAKAGFDIVQLNFRIDELFDNATETCNFAPIEKAVRRLLELNPNARVMFSLRFTMRQWAINHPDEQVGYGTGAVDQNATDEYRERVVRPSAASDALRTLVCRLIGDFGKYVEGRPWRKRLIGIRLSYGVYSEWCCYGFNDAPDTGLRMQEKFAAYEKAKRDIDDARVPTAAERKHEYNPLNPKGDNPNLNGDLLNPAEDQLVIDYYEFLADTIADLLLAMAKATKEALPGRLVGAYYGYVYAQDPPEGANALLEKVLSSQYIDYLSNPPAYNVETRRAGGPFSPRTIPASFRRHRKLCLIEDDSRFHHVIDWLKSDNDGRRLCTTDAVETEMCMRRNWLNMFFDGDGIQLNDPITQSGKRPHAFDDPAVFKAIADSRAALAKAGKRAEKSGNEIAVVFSPRERFHMDGGVGSYFSWNIHLTPLHRLYSTGAAFDVLTLEDYLEEKNFGDYRILLFLNAFSLTETERKEIVRRTRNSGVSVIWVGPAGGVTDEGFSNEAMTALTGLTSSGVARRSNVKWPGCDRLLIDGEFYSYVSTNASGGVSILVPEFPKVAGYRQILKAAGAWFYADSGDCFRRQGDVFMLHTGTAGTHTVRLPETGVNVRELFTGRDFDSDAIILNSDGPATWLFKVNRSKLNTIFCVR